ncbi:dihydroxyacetone kinase subunit L [Bombilactobacillus bombi]|uniref:phosphoenolpyruvate--glycerone phosphotransferase n=1 Tax=Bombilactobacillus bombi TaxID=1303590 RepID=A0A3R6UXR6_9LACO|nr:dihydroxyacetone kinase subunit DhaL [Bombilactobacillus bombi]RHW49926.1 dihydroxyacetone kinase subunit L [Bombilactobacillus bombi]
MELTTELATKWFELYVQSIQEHKDQLNELDTAIGDGDHGTNMLRGVEQVQTVLQQQATANLSDLLKQVAFALISKVGGASGPLYGTALLDMSKYVQEHDSQLSNLIASGAAGIKRRGQSQVGDKTMLDVWQPVADDLANNQFNSSNLDQHLQATADLEAKKGRASYLGERSVGHLDPGAKSSELLFDCLLQVLNK